MGARILPPTLIVSLAVGLLCFVALGSRANEITESTWLELEERITPVGLPDKDSLDDMETLLEWLKSARKCRKMRLFCARVPDSNIIEALEKIEKLDLIFKKDKCDLESLELRAYLKTEFEKYELVNLNKLFKHYTKLISLMCLRQFPNVHNELKFQFHRTGINLVLVKRIEAFFYLLIQDKLTGQVTDIGETGELKSSSMYDRLNSVDVYRDFIENKGLPVTSDRAAEIAYIAIERLVKKHMDVDFVRNNAVIGPDGEPAFYGNQAKALFSQFVFYPCKRYIQFYGQRLFQLADFETQFIDAGNKNFIRSNKLGFYLDWAQYEGCKRLMDHGEPMINKLQRIASRNYAAKMGSGALVDKEESP